MYPVLNFAIGQLHFAMPTFALSSFVGAVIVLFFTFKRSINFDIEFKHFAILLLLTIFFGAIGARLIFVFSRLPGLIHVFSLRMFIHLLFNGGIVFFGGLMGVLFGLKLFTVIKKQYSPFVFQMAAPAIPLFQGFGRIGCLLGGCCYGFHLSTPFVLFEGVQFDRFPVPLFESLFCFAIFVVLVVRENKKDDIDLLRIYLLSYAAFRFAAEFLRDDLIRGHFFGLSTSQWISLTIVFYYILQYIRTTRLTKNA